MCSGIINRIMPLFKRCYSNTILIPNIESSIIWIPREMPSIHDVLINLWFV